MSEHDPIQALLEATGPRPAVDAARTRRVRDAVHADWRLALSRRWRARRVVMTGTIAAGVALAVVAVLRSQGGGVGPAPSAGQVVRITGGATAESGTFPFFRSREALATGSSVSVGSVVTTGPDSRLALSVESGYALRLDAGTILRVASGRRFTLERGAVFVQSTRVNPNAVDLIEIETPYGTIAPTGTQFQARLDASFLTVRVREGAVTVRTASSERSAKPGRLLSVDRSGTIDDKADDAKGAGWAWAESIATMMDIEGKTLREFLDWVARERGVRLRFESQALEARAPSIVLHGSLAGMTLEQATETVFLTSGLTHRWDEGELSVGPAN